ncbi:hypothetical protein SAMN05216389_11255 [Oceanobacillus limi]|uniref:Uncharacterized protein n=1 Tax=Oceanobacillus limi TaxID=930131 RepID=A0A1I0EQP6_9BACI|nr:hypothetical protein SAMN05216389_11255 [Oceanobacillus limi]
MAKLNEFMEKMSGYLNTLIKNCPHGRTNFTSFVHFGDISYEYLHDPSRPNLYI